MTDKQDPIAHAARLLREAAEELRQAHAYNNSEGWENETDAKAAYDEHLAAAQALEDWEQAVGAGGVSGPLIGQPQAMPDLTALTERGAKAWTGVDAQALREGRWYMVTHDGVATLCEDRRDAEKEAKDADMAWPHSGPHRAVQLVEASTAGFTAADMATASAQGFRDGVASLAASAGEPVAIRPDIQAVLAMLDVPVIARMSSHEGKLLKPGQEPPAFESAVPLVREWDHRRACESIIAALSRNN